MSQSITDSELFVAVSRAARTLSEHTDWRIGVGEFLESLGRPTDASRVWLFQVVERGDDYYVTRYIHEWAKSDEFSNIHETRFDRQRVDADTPDKQALYAARRNGELLQHHQNEVGAHLADEFRRQGICSMLTVPIQVDGYWWGILGFDHCERRVHYPPSYLAALEMAAVLFSNVILRERLHWEANHDYLTRLFNRRYLIQWVDQQGCTLDADEQWGIRERALVIFDVDWFKQINDQFGHQAGDRALKRVAETMVNLAPRGCPVGRLGGEEFAAWIVGAPGVARQYAQAVRRRVRSQFITPDGQGRLSVSAGIAVVTPADAQLPNLFEAMFTRADRALFSAKEGGRDRVAVC